MSVERSVYDLKNPPEDCSVPEVLNATCENCKKIGGAVAFARAMDIMEFFCSRFYENGYEPKFYDKADKKRYYELSYTYVMSSRVIGMLAGIPEKDIAKRLYRECNQPNSFTSLSIKTLATIFNRSKSTIHDWVS